MTKKVKLLLISNSYPFDGDYLDHAKAEIKNFLKDAKSILFVPYALKNLDEYAKQNEIFFKKTGIDCTSIHEKKNLKQTIKNARSIFIGGGNTFRLLKILYEKNLLPELKKKILTGTPYMGSSAGVHIVTPSIRTTNDMPITEPKSFRAIGILPFQINPHFIDSDPKSTFMGETREKRLEQFHEESSLPILGLRENTWVSVEKERIILGGKKRAKLIVKGKPSKEYKPGSRIEFLEKFSAR